MADVIHLDANQIPAHLRGILGYTGRKFRALVTPSVMVPCAAGVWSGGYRDTYHMVRLADGATLHIPDSGTTWPHPTPDYRVEIPEGAAVVRESIMANHGTILTFYVRPDNAAAVLPAPTTGTLSESESIVLAVMSAYIPAVRREYAARAGITGAAYDAALDGLKAAGYVSRGNALTTAGKNAASQLPRDTERKAGV